MTIINKLDEIIYISNKESIAKNNEKYELEIHHEILFLSLNDLKQTNLIIDKLDYLNKKGLLLNNNLNIYHHMMINNHMDSETISYYVSFLNQKQNNSCAEKLFLSFIDNFSRKFDSNNIDSNEVKDINQKYILIFEQLIKMGSDFNFNKIVFVNDFIRANINYFNKEKQPLPFFDYLLKNYDNNLMTPNLNSKNDFFNKKTNFSMLLLRYKNDDVYKNGSIDFYNYLKTILPKINIKKIIAKVKSFDDYQKNDLLEYIDIVNNSNNELKQLKSSIKFQKKEPKINLGRKNKI